MKIEYPFIIIICIILFALAFIINNKKINGDKNKYKVANTEVIKNTKEYKSIVKQYRNILYILYICIFICLLATSLLSSRIIEEHSKKENIYNRDIILCMDVSSSVNNLNAELVDTYKEIVSQLQGERFGISVFNTSSYLLVPLTDDYDYILEVLDILGTSIDVNLNYDKYKDMSSSERLYLMEYLYYGTQVGSSTRGTSLAGDGLASCVFDFPELDTDTERSRIIVLSTDNQISGKQYIDITDAASISREKNITVYTIAPTNAVGKSAEELEKATLATGGEYYVHEKGPTVKKIVNGIESKEKSLLEGGVKTVVTDYPRIPFVIALVSFILLIIIDKVVGI